MNNKTRKEQLQALGRMKDSDIDYTDAPATNADFWQNATINKPTTARQQHGDT